MITRVCGLLAASLFAIQFAGCGPSTPIPLAECEGVVKYRGQEVGGALVEMQTPDGKYKATSVTDEFGWFRMKTTIDGTSYEGVPVGKVQIRISKSTVQGGTNDQISAEQVMEMAQGRMSTDGTVQIPKNVLPERYASFETSEEERTIQKRGVENRFTFELTD